MTPRRTKPTVEQIEKMIELHRKGYSFRMIGERYGIGEATAYRLVKAFEKRGAVTASERGHARRVHTVTAQG